MLLSPLPVKARHVVWTSTLMPLARPRCDTALAGAEGLSAFSVLPPQSLTYRSPKHKRRVRTFKEGQQRPDNNRKRQRKHTEGHQSEEAR